MRINYSRLRVSKFEYWYFFMIVIFGGMATPMLKSMMFYTGYPLAFVFPILMTGLLIYKYRVVFTYRYLISMAVLFLWILLQFIKWRQNMVTLSFFLFYNLTIAYVVAKHYKHRLLVLYEYFLVRLSLIGLILWALVVVLPFVFDPLLTQLNIGQANPAAICKSNLIVFSLTDNGNNALADFIRRNAGFTWEPGRYAVMILPAIYFNLLIHKFNYNKDLLILILALFSTNSTTGILTAFVLVVFYLINKRNMVWRAIPLFVLMAGFVTVMGVSNKLEETNTEGYGKIEEVVGVMDHYDRIGDDDVSFSLQRFDAFKAQFLSFVSDPLLGYGPDKMNAFFKTHLSSRLDTPNGNMQILAKYGIFLGFLIFLLSYRSSKEYVGVFKAKGQWMFFLIFWLMSMSYELVEVPIFLSMLMFSFYNYNGQHKKINMFVVNKRRFLHKKEIMVADRYK